MGYPLRSETDGPDPSRVELDHCCAFLGTSEAAQRVRGLIVRAARVDATVLVTGESGVGKELVAREIHARGARSAKPFVPLNCAAIPETLVEAELFGHEPGAFTDARDKRRGAFERSHEGTLFLDEIGDLSPTAQPKLLRALECGEIVRVGGEVARPVDLRIVAATHQDLARMCGDGRFRSDLYYRLRIVVIEVPPLRDRLDDLPVLARHFIRQLARRHDEEPREITPGGLDYLRKYHWPGNVRELKAAIERAMTLTSDRELDATSFDLEPPIPPGYRLGNLLELEWKDARDGFAAAYAERLLKQYGGNVRRAAEAAGLATRGLYKMLQRVGLRPGQGLPSRDR